MQANILKLFNNQKYNDLKFKIEDKHIYVHKLIIQINSAYFQEYFGERMGAIEESTEYGNIETEIKIKDYSYDVYYASLEYLYTDCIVIETQKAMDLLFLANNYKEEN